MIDETMDDLIQREIDGQNSAEETARLREMLEAEPELREHYERLTGVVSLLEQTPMIDPPASIKETVVAATLSGPANGGNRDTTRVPPPRFSRGRRRDLAAFATGAIAATLGFVLLTELPRGVEGDPSDLGGTIGMSSRPNILDRELLDRGWVRGQASTYRQDDAVRVEVNLDTARDVAFQLGFDPRSWTVTALEPQPAFGGRCFVEPDRVRFEAVSAGHYVVLLRPISMEAPSSTIQLELTGQGERIERALVVRSEPNGG